MKTQQVESKSEKSAALDDFFETHRGDRLRRIIDRAEEAGLLAPLQLPDDDRDRDYSDPVFEQRREFGAELIRRGLALPLTKPEKEAFFSFWYDLDVVLTATAAIQQGDDVGRLLRMLNREMDQAIDPINESLPRPWTLI